MRLIDADAFIEYLEDTDYSGSPDTLWEYTPQDITRMEIYEIKCQPTVDAVPVIHAHWVDDPRTGDYVCTNCLDHNIVRSRYCPNCGAIMDEEA